MKEGEMLSALRRYEAGESTLEEESQLLRAAKESGDPLELWSNYVKGQQPMIPANLKSAAWRNIETHRNKKRKYRLMFVAIAASIALLLSVNFFGQREGIQDYQTKEKLLKEAIAMFAEPQQSEVAKRVIYEDEIIIIYTN